MKENKEVKQNDNTHQKVYWIIGIAVVVFLILLFGSLIGLKITKDGSNNILNKFDNISNIDNGQGKQNYEVLEDGTKSNNSVGIANAEFTFNEGIRVSHCSILERENGFSEISLDIENITEEKLNGLSLLVKLYDSEDKLITEFPMITSDIEPKAPTVVRVLQTVPCVHAEKLMVELQTSSDSGEIVTVE